MRARDARRAVEETIRRRRDAAEAVSDVSGGHLVFAACERPDSRQPRERLGAVLTDEFCNVLECFAMTNRSYPDQEEELLAWAVARGPVLGAFAWKGALSHRSRSAGGLLAAVLYDLQPDYRLATSLEGSLGLQRALAVSRVPHDALLIEDACYASLMLAELSRKTGLAGSWLDKRSGLPILPGTAGFRE